VLCANAEDEDNSCLNKSTSSGTYVPKEGQATEGAATNWAIGKI
jgi:hypothetical protein